MLVSVVISAYNEEKYLPELFNNLNSQDYLKKNIEIILINAISTDKTKLLMLNFQEKYKEDFFDIKVLDNLKKVQPSGFNLGVKNSNGKCILKIDAHSKITNNFITENVNIINTGEYICGGRRPTIVESNDNFSRTLHLTEENIFGSGVAAYRNSSKTRYVNSIFHGMYRKEVFENCGLLDEQLIRTEDNEFHYRIRQKGYKILYSDNILSYQFIRPTLKKMIKQKFSNGYWIGLTSHIYPKAFSVFHFVPLVFVLSIIFSILIIPITSLFFIALSLVYLLFTSIITILTILNNKFNFMILLMPILLFLVHFSYGIGTFIGLLKGFSWKKEYYFNK